MKNFVLLSAGRGSRLAELTSETHKSLLPIGGKPGIQHIVEQILETDNRDVVVVTGYKEGDVKTFLEAEFGNKVRTVFNANYAADTNILSADIGVDALKNPELGYMIVETDIVLEPEGWKHLFAEREISNSEWSTFGNYSEHLTGGALLENKDGFVEEIVYAPIYNEKYQTYKKLLGTLLVGKNEVLLDRELRKEMIENSIAEYYLAPWMKNINRLRCKAFDMSQYFACSFNNLEAFHKAENGYRLAINKIK